MENSKGGYLSELNDNQLEAVSHINGPLLILAGAGTGKTKVLTSRIIHILNKMAMQFLDQYTYVLNESIKTVDAIYVRVIMKQIMTITTFELIGRQCIESAHAHTHRVLTRDIRRAAQSVRNTFSILQCMCVHI